MDKCTHEVRMEYWKNIITQCQNRPEGQSAKQWMDANGICEEVSVKSSETPKNVLSKSHLQIIVNILVRQSRRGCGRWNTQKILLI